MSNFIYTTSSSFPIPFLVESDKLESLDKIITPEWERLTSLVDQAFQAEFEEKVKDDPILLKRLSEDKPDLGEIEKRKQEIKDRMLMYSSLKYKKEFSLVIQLGEIKKIKVDSFESALKNVDLFGETPRGFELDCTAGKVRLNMKLAKDSLSYRISPEHLPEARDVFAALEQWTRTIKPPYWQRIWFEWGILVWGIWLISLGVAGLIISGSLDPATEHYRQQAYELLRAGVTQENQIRATEILLALDTRYNPDGLRLSVPIWFWIVSFIGPIICLALSIKPKSILGIGKGQILISRWRFYIRVIFIVIPAFILLYILVPFFNKWFLGT